MRKFRVDVGSCPAFGTDMEIRSLITAGSAGLVRYLMALVLTSLPPPV